MKIGFCLFLLMALGAQVANSATDTGIVPGDQLVEEGKAESEFAKLKGYYVSSGKDTVLIDYRNARQPETVPSSNLVIKRYDYKSKGKQVYIIKRSGEPFVTALDFYTRNQERAGNGCFVKNTGYKGSSRNITFTVWDYTMAHKGCAKRGMWEIDYKIFHEDRDHRGYGDYVVNNKYYAKNPKWVTVNPRRNSESLALPRTN